MQKQKRVKTLFGAFKEAGKIKDDFLEDDSEQSSENEPVIKKRRLVLSNIESTISSSEEEDDGKEIQKPPKLLKNQNKYNNNITNKSLKSSKSFVPNFDSDTSSSSSSTIESDLASHLKTMDKVNIELGEEQMRVLDLVVNKNKSVFFTGAAGTGKTVLLKEIIKRLQNKYWEEFDSVAVTASTGLAALNIGGKTYHSYFGIGLGTADVNTLIKSISSKKNIVKIWKACRVLIIDEISLVSSYTLSKLATIACYFKKNELPFGGIQLVFVGDFFQLPPIVESYRKLLESGIVKNFTEYNDYKNNIFAFKAIEWDMCLNYQIELTKVYRQISDPHFIKYLNEVRVGMVSNEADTAFHKLSRNLQKIEDIEPTQLYPTKREANMFNLKRLYALPGKSISYKCQESGKLFGTKKFKIISDSFLAPNEISLKVGSQVMLIKNYTDELVNGSLGVVVDFIDETKSYLLAEGKECTGGECGFLEKDKNFNNLSILQKNNIIESDNKEIQRKDDHRSIDFRKNLEDGLPKIYPVVRFIGKSNSSSQLKVVYPHNFDYLHQKTEEVLVRKRQLPLILAWALSVHKSQGQTYNLLKVDVSRTFEFGQVYVALSRVTSRRGLQVIGWNRNKVFTNPLVTNFYLNIITLTEEKWEQINTEIEKEHNNVDEISHIPNTEQPKIIQKVNKKEITGGYINLSELSDYLNEND